MLTLSIVRLLALSLLPVPLYCLCITLPWSGSPADSDIPPQLSEPEKARKSSDSFTFVRVRYDSTGGYGESWYRHENRDWMRWETDYPRGELNLLFRLNQLTSMQVDEQPIVKRLTDKDLCDYPFLFMSDVGWQELTEEEVNGLRKFLQRGGFLWIDDFWGDAELANMMRNTGKLGPEWHWKRIPNKHPILSTVYPLDACPQIPARIFYEQYGTTVDPPFVHRGPTGGMASMSQVNFLGLFDAEGNLSAVATHNTDLADGWEREGEDRDFFLRFSIDSYAMSINILTYAMTH